MREKWSKMMSKLPHIGEAGAVDILGVRDDERGHLAGALDGRDHLLVGGLEQILPLDLEHHVAHLETVAAGSTLDPADPHLAEPRSRLGLDLDPERPGLVPHDRDRPAQWAECRVSAPPRVNTIDPSPPPKKKKPELLPAYSVASASLGR